jgi:DNA-binding SARP family transcriptional activator
MTVTIHLLGRPSVERPDALTYAPRSRKSWGLLVFLLLAERPQSRSQLADLLFADADDPLRALRWSLAEIRRCLGIAASVEGDPVLLDLADDVVVDLDVIARGNWSEAVALPGLGADLLEGVSVRAAPGFDAWLLSERRRVAAASEAILHEAAVGSMSRGDLEAARAYAVRAAAMSPLEENHQALLIRLYRLAGEDAAARAQYESWSRTLARELGVSPGAAVEAALHTTRRDILPATDHTAIHAIVEAGAAAISAGAVDVGVQSLRGAVVLSDRADAPLLRISSRMRLAEGLIHSLGGLDEEGVAILHEADEIAHAQGDDLACAQARAELGYVDFLRAQYDRAEHWLTDALDLAEGSASIVAKVRTYLGSIESDRANYAQARVLLEQATQHAKAADEPRREAYALSMFGRISLLTGDLIDAEHRLAASIKLIEAHQWLAFLPWPQALLGHVHLARGDNGAASEALEQAFARACQLGDPCWEGLSARGLALVAEASGDVDQAFSLLADARTRSRRLADPYIWLDAYILDALCTLGRRHGHRDTAVWVEAMRTLASRTGMREMSLRALLHGAALGNRGDAAAAAMLAPAIDNPCPDQLTR